MSEMFYEEDDEYGRDTLINGIHSVNYVYSELEECYTGKATHVTRDGFQMVVYYSQLLGFYLVCVYMPKGE